MDEDLKRKKMCYYLQKQLTKLDYLKKAKDCLEKDFIYKVTPYDLLDKNSQILIKEGLKFSDAYEEFTFDVFQLVEELILQNQGIFSTQY
jgi:hypothetical protein